MWTGMKKIDILFSCEFMGKFNLIFTTILAAAFLLSCSNPSSNTKTYALTMTVSPAEGGVISPSSGFYSKGESVQLKAIAHEGWHFVQWEGDHSGVADSVMIIINKNMSVTGIFVKKDYPLNVTIEGEGHVEEAVVAKNYPFQTTVRLTAIPAEGWVFSGWDGTFRGLENPIDVTIEGGVDVLAIFQLYNGEVTDIDGNRYVTVYMANSIIGLL